MNEIREQSYELFKSWSATAEAFQKRPGGNYGPGLNVGSGTRLSRNEGKLEYTFVEAELHHSGKRLGRARIDVNFENITFEVTHPNNSREIVNAVGLDVTDLARRVLNELIGGAKAHEL